MARRFTNLSTNYYPISNHTWRAVFPAEEDASVGRRAGWTVVDTPQSNRLRQGFVHELKSEL